MRVERAPVAPIDAEPPPNVRVQRLRTEAIEAHPGRLPGVCLFERIAQA
jgi:hypothetical protein